ncbi:hypothetical protein IZY60_00370 [Lutibacter sp. B2]|nr:hypothetical protein [Lutibacter sp. B2]
MNPIKKLVQLQEIEEKKKKEKIFLEEIIKGTDIRLMIKNHQLFKKDCEKKQKDLIVEKKQLDKLEKELKKSEFNREENKERLYSGNIKDSKQLEKLMQKQEDLENEIEGLDTEILKQIDLVEIMEKNMKEEKDKEYSLGVKINKMLSKRNKDKEEKEKNINLLEKEKEVLENEISHENMLLYNEIKNRVNKPLAKLEENMCMGCHMDLPIITVQKIRAKEIVMCSNCGRILYNEEI